MYRKITLFSIVLFIGGCVSFGAFNWDKAFGPASPKDRIISQVADNHVDFWNDVKPVLDNRCVVCHGCFDAPCQIKLSSIEGIDRGGSKSMVYHQSRLTAAKTTRLFEDAETTAQWREKKFYPILNERNTTTQANQQASLLYRSLQLKSQNPLPDTQVLGKEFSLGINRKQTCPSIEKYATFSDKNPLWGMPYALPDISPNEKAKLMDWVSEGANYTQRPPLESQYTNEIAHWESYLNRDSLKAQLISRYIYEHLFLAHLYFSELSDDTFFLMVRSSTPPGQPIKRIATRRPYDHPGVDRVYYRLVPELETIVAKNHQPYALNKKRLQRWQALFEDKGQRAFTVNELPSYEPEVASNPFKAYAAIPVTSRYEFMLDEAQFTIMNFIKGPVCRGQVALNVVRDHFWVFFVEPNIDHNIAVSELLDEQKNALELPSARENVYSPLTTWRRYAKHQREYLHARDEFLSNSAKKGTILDIDVVWDGNNENENAALTVFRHFDTATVEKGMIGPAPRTAWVIDYTLLERIHYLLVAGYDVYGNVGHQVLSRMFMDFLRMEGESNFLLFLPELTRKRERELWYRGASKDVLDHLQHPGFEKQIVTSINFSSGNPKREFYGMLREHLGDAVSKRRDLTALPQGIIKSAQKLQSLYGANSAFLAETSFIEIKGRDKTYYLTLLKHNARLRLTGLFSEGRSHVPEENTVTVIQGLVGAYPNALFSVKEDVFPALVDTLMAMQSEEDYQQAVTHFGIRRTSNEFWPLSDRLHAALKAENNNEFGILDYNRLENR